MQYELLNLYVPGTSIKIYLAPHYVVSEPFDSAIRCGDLGLRTGAKPVSSLLEKGCLARTRRKDGEKASLLINEFFVLEFDGTLRK